MQRHYRAVFLSPHLDDAVFSCGGLIAKLVESGEHVLIVNIFSETPSPPNRHDEESEVARFLGVEVMCLGELDAVIRHKSYRSLLHMFSRIETSDRARLPDVANKLKTLLEGIRHETLYVPLGVGWHVDHLLTHEIGQRIGEKSKIRFYEDTPYCLLPRFTEHRLQQLGGMLIPHVAGAARDAGRAMMSMAPTQKFVRSPFRFLIEWIITLWFWAVLRRQSRIKESPSKFAPEPMQLEAQLAKKIDASLLYKSQFGEFFLDRSDCESRLRKYSRQIGGGTAYVERYWQPAGDVE